LQKRTRKHKGTGGNDKIKLPASGTSAQVGAKTPGSCRALERISIVDDGRTKSAEPKLSSGPILR
jgi:hypothetical protein